MAYARADVLHEPTSGKELRLLVVEDSRTYSTALCRGLEKGIGLPIVACRSLNELHAAVTEDPGVYTMAVVDLNLPDAPYGEAIDFTVQRGIPTIVHTASFDIETRNRIMARDVIDYVTKDSELAIDTVVSTVRRALSNRTTRVLVVDDAKATRHLLAHMLRVQQYEVLEAASGKEALAMLENTPDIRIVVSDYNMPDIDGYELTRRIRRKYSSDRLRIIGISSSNDRMVSIGFLKAGASDFISMPFVPEELQCRIAIHVETMEQLDQLHHLASRDPLTGLYNRRHFFQRTAGLVDDARARAKKSAIAILDIDDFKRLNDSHGHELGDQALIRVAECLMQSVADSNHLVARIGGEEFAVLFPGIDAKTAMRLSDHIRLDIAYEALSVGEQRIGLTVSVGVAEVADGESIAQSLAAADRALYLAKRDGRNQVRGEAA